jgi:hypothetical protein
MNVAAANLKVANIRKGEKDANDYDIEEVYYRKAGEYAVYRTKEKVHVKFADEDGLACEQRRALAPLVPLRDEIDGLIQYWRDSKDSDPYSRGFFGLQNPRRHMAKVHCQDRRVGGALVQALEDDVPGARLWLEKIKSDMINERIAYARFEYLLTTFATMLIVMFLAWLLSALLPQERPATLLLKSGLVHGVALFLSVTLGLPIFLAAGLIAARRWTPSPRAGALVALGGALLLASAAWFVAVWLWPGLRSADFVLSRTMAIGVITLLLVLTIWIVFATAHRPSSTRRAVLLFGLISIPLFAVLIWPQTPTETVAGPYGIGLQMWRGFAAGAVGAFFSIALAIRSRTVLPDLLRTANMMDAVLRVVIGAIGGAVLVGLIRAKVIEFPLMSPDAQLFNLVAGFFAGFSERLVPDLLDKASEKPATFDAQMAASRAQRDYRVDRHSTHDQPVRAPTGETSGATAQPPAEPAGNDNEDDAEVEVGPEGFHLEDDEVTRDEDLPAAIGGIARA